MLLPDTIHCDLDNAVTTPDQLTVLSVIEMVDGYGLTLEHYLLCPSCALSHTSHQPATT